MGKVNIRTGMKKEREGCVQPMGKPVPGDGPTPQDRELVLLSASGCCCGSMSQFPSLLSELLAGKCFATGSEKHWDALSLSPRGCKIWSQSWKDTCPMVPFPLCHRQPL